MTSVTLILCQLDASASAAVPLGVYNDFALALNITRIRSDLSQLQADFRRAATTAPSREATESNRQRIENLEALRQQVNDLGRSRNEVIEASDRIRELQSRLDTYERSIEFGRYPSVRSMIDEITLQGQRRASAALPREIRDGINQTLPDSHIENLIQGIIERRFPSAFFDERINNALPANYFEDLVRGMMERRLNQAPIMGRSRSAFEPPREDRQEATFTSHNPRKRVRALSPRRERTTSAPIASTSYRSPQSAPTGSVEDEYLTLGGRSFTWPSNLPRLRQRISFIFAHLRLPTRPFDALSLGTNIYISEDGYLVIRFVGDPTAPRRFVNAFYDSGLLRPLGWEDVDAFVGRPQL